MRITKIKGCWVLRGERRSTWEPIEASQIEEVRRHGEQEESKQWGEGGRQALRWFELGEIKSGLYQDPFGESASIEVHATPTQRAMSWFRSLIGGPSPYRLGWSQK